MKTVVGVSLLFTCWYVHAADWAPMPIAPDGSRYEMHRLRQEDVVGNMRVFWVRIFDRDRKSPIPNSMMQMQTDCSTSKIRGLRYVIYSDDGKTLETSNRAGAFDTPPPDSVGESLVTITCMKFEPDPAASAPQ